MAIVSQKKTKPRAAEKNTQAVTSNPTVLTSFDKLLRRMSINFVGFEKII